MKSIFRILAAFLFGVLGLVSCERASEDDVRPTLEPTLTSIQNNIFDLNCAVSGCHTGSNPPQGMNLSNGLAFSNIVDVSSMEVPTLRRIEPGNPEQSYLYLKILGSPAIMFSRMPFGRDPLSDDEIGVIKQWIEAGALNN